MASGVCGATADGGAAPSGSGAGTATGPGGTAAAGGGASGAAAGFAASPAGGGSTGASAGTSAGGGSTGCGRIVLISRGGGSDGAGFGGSTLRANPAFLPLRTGASAKMSPDGSAIFRWRASRSTNWRATTSSIVLDALLTSMP
jgi:hypothetical protein